MVIHEKWGRSEVDAPKSYQGMAGGWCVEWMHDQTETTTVPRTSACPPHIMSRDDPVRRGAFPPPHLPRSIVGDHLNRSGVKTLTVIDTPSLLVMEMVSEGYFPPIRYTALLVFPCKVMQRWREPAFGKASHKGDALYGRRKLLPEERYCFQEMCCFGEVSCFQLKQKARG